MEYCPNCGHPLSPNPSNKLGRLASAYSQYHHHHMTTYQSTAIQPWSPPTSPGNGEVSYTEAERRRPARPLNAESDFLVPLLQALGTGAFVTLAALVIAYYYRGFTWGMACATGIIAAGLFWLIVVFANRSLLWVVERVVNDPGSDNNEAQKGSQDTLRLEMHHKGDGRRTKLSEFGITAADFLEFARGVVLENRGLAEATWTGAGKLFSKPKYDKLLDFLTQEGIVRWRNENAPAQGRELTEEGHETLLALVEKNARTHAHAVNGGGDYEFIEGVG